MFLSLGLFFFIFGIAIGSFLNVVILRYNTGRGLDGRSQCFSCGKQLQWFELIPVVSFLYQKGKCSQCGSKVSWQYPLVELLTGIVFVAVYWKLYPFIFLAFSSFMVSYIITVLIFCILIVIFVYDLRHKIIPDGLSLALALLGFINLCISLVPLSLKVPSLSALIAGPLLFLPFAILWFVSKGTWMGFGDAKLAFGMGLILGIMGGLSAIILAFWIGAVVSIALLVIQKVHLSLGGRHLTMKSEIPFAPFLIIGFSLVFFFHIAIPGISSLAYLSF
ncbi:MAG: prepilin peptidase [Nitrosopumilus sp.]|nr:prepilin peptidase [Nitrosopumilus sp.]MBA3550793.1 prepilin peptidase [Patescibacteria group bacterium]